MDVSICAGKFKGKKLRFPDAFSDFRPTKLMVREAVCSSIQMDIVNAQVLELCGGSGVFALELLSRGAEQATVVELNSKRAEAIKTVAADLGVDPSVDVKAADIKDVVPKLKDATFDIIFFDPPYYTDDLAMLIPEVLDLVAPGGVCIFEHASDDKFIDSVDIPHTFKEKKKKYGKSTIRYYRSKEF